MDHPPLKYAANIALAISCVWAWLLLLETHYPEVPYWFADEWSVISLAQHTPFWETVQAGHNGTPSYIQNGLWWLDFHVLKTEGTLQRWMQTLFFGVAALLFFIALRRCGMSRTARLFTLCLLVSLWFSHANRAHFFHYVWRGFETSLALMLIMAALVVLFRPDKNSNEYSRFKMNEILALLIAWPALYMHGGFGVLPIFALAIFLQRPSRNVMVITATLLVLFLWHYKSVHYQPEHVYQDSTPLWEWIYGYAMILGGIPYHLVKHFINAKSAGIVAAATSIIAVSCFTYLGWRGVQGRLTRIQTMAFVFLGYPMILALAAVIIRARVHGWEYLLAARYSIFSIYIILAFALLLYDWQFNTRQKQWKNALTRATYLYLALLIGLSWHGSFRVLADAPSLNQSMQTYMIPYTLDPWTLAPGPATSPRRVQSAEAMRNGLIQDGKSVFGSKPYLRFASATHLPSDIESIPLAIEQVAVLHATPVNNQRLLHLSLNWPDAIPKSHHLCVLADGHSLSGWALPQHRRTQLGFARSRETRGFAMVADHATVLYALIIDEDGRWVGRSEPLTID